ncbi:UDP-N-acetylmuramate--L-alanine ligase [Phaeodactylibacter luteus]|uniref:UDP-N-acetylmuramate--L-alanine ligase n=1 Tax=Phaeodactylibacter luteus TaxID=1564516 RepID=A0A5C6RHA9_9BACT|nr:UDP-N-acetylmuramate--L-alanine ligase [Phaeodactylibacter luteus]TXB61527.1 UDP-N-acetylmuramate--L-alanine ligase [Phaeodactylibacter luteus]
MDLNSIQTVYFIGVGGIGMSALARYFNQRGARVYGYDKTATELTRTLAAEGIDIHYEDDIRFIPQGVDLVVYTPAVPAAHQELQYFQANGFPVKKRAEVLGIISRGMKAIAIAGTHGKTTTTTLTTFLLRSCGIDCSAFLGGIALDFETNFVAGHTEWVVVEADEYDRSFLHLSPEIAVILSMDADHLDIYGDRETMLETGFRAFAKRVKPGGAAYVQHRWVEELGPVGKTIAFGLGHGAYRAENIRVEEGFFTFDFYSPQGVMQGLQLSLPGRHNVENATVAIAIALQLGAAEADIRLALREFRGIRRRFEFLSRSEKGVYIDDYAHHPSELQAAIGAARELYPGKRLTGVFQPHLFTRTRDFAPGFAEALAALDEVLLMEIYPAREAPLPGIDSAWLLEQIPGQDKRLVSSEAVPEVVKQLQPEVLLTLGAGDIDLLRAPLKRYFENR